MGADPGEGRHMCYKSQNGAGGGAGPKRPVVLAWPLEGTVWEMDPPELHKSLGSCMAIFEEAPGPSHTQANIITGEQKTLAGSWLTLS